MQAFEELLYDETSTLFLMFLCDTFAQRYQYILGKETLCAIFQEFLYNRTKRLPSRPLPPPPYSYLSRDSPPLRRFFRIRFPSTNQIASSKVSTNYLMDKRLLIVDIAQRLGFSTQSGFIKAFKAYFSISPNAWRKKYLSDKHTALVSKFGETEDI